MLPDRVSNPGPPTYESGALPIALRGPAIWIEEDGSTNASLQRWTSQPYFTMIISSDYLTSTFCVGILEEKAFLMIISDQRFNHHNL